MSEPTIIGFVCSASRENCECRCPESCGHKWDGPTLVFDNGGTATCSKCGMSAMDHDVWVTP